MYNLIRLLFFKTNGKGKILMNMFDEKNEDWQDVSWSLMRISK